MHFFLLQAKLRILIPKTGPWLDYFYPQRLAYHLVQLPKLLK
jgi:hypothetical protein